MSSWKSIEIGAFLENNVSHENVPAALKFSIFLAFRKCGLMYNPCWDKFSESIYLLSITNYGCTQLSATLTPGKYAPRILASTMRIRKLLPVDCMSTSKLKWAKGLGR